MKETRTQRQKRPVLTVLRLVGAVVVGVALIATSMVLLIGGLALIIFGVNGVLFTGFDSTPEETVGGASGDASFGGLVIAVGILAILGGKRIMTRLVPRAISKVSGREFAFRKLWRIRR